MTIRDRLITAGCVAAGLCVLLVPAMPCLAVAIVATWISPGLGLSGALAIVWLAAAAHILAGAVYERIEQ